MHYRVVYAALYLLTDLLSMRATDWEFKNRALVFGLLFAFAFSLYSLDHQNSTAMLSNGLGVRFELDPDLIAHLLFVCAAFWLAVAALIRTWASSYLHANVVYAAEVKAEALVADGPYRYVRNPLYFANVLLAIGMGAMMSRSGYVAVVTGMLVFCYRLILREEYELHASQGERYESYCNAVPRLWPSLFPRIATAGRQAQWMAGFKAEYWYWGFAAAVGAFAVTLNSGLFFVILGVSLLSFWMLSWLVRRKSHS